MFSHAAHEPTVRKLKAQSSKLKAPSSSSSLVLVLETWFMVPMRIKPLDDQTAHEPRVGTGCPQRRTVATTPDRATSRRAARQPASRASGKFLPHPAGQAAATGDRSRSAENVFGLWQPRRKLLESGRLGERTLQGPPSGPAWRPRGRHHRKGWRLLGKSRSLSSRFPADRGQITLGARPMAEGSQMAALCRDAATPSIPLSHAVVSGPDWVNVPTGGGHG